MPYKETETIKLYYTIGEVSQLLKVNPSLIRFWEKEFDIIHPKKNKKGNRLFTSQDISVLKKIYHLVKERGYTLQGAKERLKNEKDETVDVVEMVRLLNKTKKFLLRLGEDLK